MVRRKSCSLSSIELEESHRVELESELQVKTRTAFAFVEIKGDIRIWSIITRAGLQNKAVACVI